MQKMWRNGSVPLLPSRGRRRDVDNLQALISSSFLGDLNLGSSASPAWQHVVHRRCDGCAFAGDAILADQKFVYVGTTYRRIRVSPGTIEIITRTAFPSAV